MDNINSILKSLEVNKTWMRKYRQHEDLYQIAIIDLYTRYKSEIIDINKRGELQTLFRAIVFNNVRWTSSRYNRMFQNHITYTNDLKEQVSTTTQEIDILEECKKVSSYWYEQYLLELYAEQGSIRKVSKLTGIPFKSVSKTILKLKKRMQ